MNEIKDGWFSELSVLWPGRALSLKVDKTLYSGRSKFQRIDVYETGACGTVLVLDGVIQCTDADEFAYQEMLTHVPMFAHPNPERALVIGGGDGGILRELSRHDCIKEVDICEIDEGVINAAKEFFPAMACGFDDPRVNVHITDGAEFIKDRQQYYDVIIVDSSDPVGPAETLFRESFYRAMKSALRGGGVIATQGESFFLHPDIVAKLVGTVRTLFAKAAYGYLMIPTYPGGHIGVCCGSLGPEIRKPSRAISPDMQNRLKYYTPDIHCAAFVLPRFATELIKEE